MEEYLSERQQIEQVRGFIRENAPWALASVLIAVGGFVGWQQWHAWQDRQAANASAKYDTLLVALGNGDLDGGARAATELRESYSRSAYADLAALALAGAEVREGKLAAASGHLEPVVNGGRDPELRLVARLRLARVQRALGKPELALATLTAAPAATAGGGYADLRGDLLADKGDLPGAIGAWREALGSKTAGTLDRELVQLKIVAAGGSPEPAGAAAPAAGDAP